MNRKKLAGGWLLKSTDNGSHMMASKGSMRVHKSLDRYTAYLVEPFKRLGMFDTAKEAMSFCDGID